MYEYDAFVSCRCGYLDLAGKRHGAISRPSDVKDGGTISGTVKFKGTAPAPKKLDVSKDKEVCAKTPKMDQSLVVNNGNLANAVVTITDIKKGKKIETQKSHSGPAWLRV